LQVSVDFKVRDWVTASSIDFGKAARLQSERGLYSRFGGHIYEGGKDDDKLSPYGFS